MTHNQKQNFLSELIADLPMGSKHFAIEHPEVKVISDLSGLPKKYKGYALHVNDHGNVTLYNVFKNGNCREVASRV